MKKNNYTEKVAKLKADIALVKTQQTTKEDKTKANNKSTKESNTPPKKTALQYKQEASKGLKDAEKLKNDVAAVNAKIQSLRESLELTKNRKQKKEDVKTQEQNQEHEGDSEKANSTEDLSNVLNQLRHDEVTSQKRIEELRSKITEVNNSKKHVTENRTQAADERKKRLAEKNSHLENLKKTLSDSHGVLEQAKRELADKESRLNFSIDVASKLQQTNDEIQNLAEVQSNLEVQEKELSSAVSEIPS